MWLKEKVNKLVKKYKTSDPFEIASCLNIHIVEWDLHHEINGYYKYDRRNRYIVINNNLDDVMKRYVCAHELGHSELHPRLNTPFLNKNTLVSTDRIEREANRFAIELMIPDEHLLEYEGLTIEQIAALYGISADLVKLKIFER